MFTLYKIYYGDELVYLGRTQQPLKRRLHGHFFKKRLQKALDVHRVSRVECAQFSTCADMYLYEIYYLNKLHPALNRDDVAGDGLTVSLPEVEFTAFECDLMDKWRAEKLARRQATIDKRRETRARNRAARLAAEGAAEKNEPGTA